MTLRRLNPYLNCALAAKDGEIGTISDFYFDDHQWTVRYVEVDTGGWLFGRKVLIPPQTLGRFDASAGVVAVHLTKQQVEESPSIEADAPLSREHEAAWHQHFGLADYWGAGQAATLGDGRDGGLLPEEAPAGTKPLPIPLLVRASEVRDYAIHAPDGDIGRIEDFLVDDAWTLQELVVLRSWLAGTEVLLAPVWIERIDEEGMKVHVRLSREAIRTAPTFDGVLER